MLRLHVSNYGKSLHIYMYTYLYGYVKKYGNGVKYICSHIQITRIKKRRQGKLSCR